MRESLTYKDLFWSGETYDVAQKILHNIDPTGWWTYPMFPSYEAAHACGVDTFSVKNDAYDVRIDFKGKNEAPRIIIQQNLSDAAKRFACAFGLGRILFSLHLRESEDRIDHYDVRPEQRRAYHFAQCLMMPAWSIRIAVDNLNNGPAPRTPWKFWKWPRELCEHWAKPVEFISRLAPMYGVTEAAIERRMHCLYTLGHVT